MVKKKFRCPWCGTNFQTGQELDAHARIHYIVEEIAVNEIAA
jgi:uncharacterized protein (DUF2225 family)